ncbi:hypothetical protein WN51_02016 [Melipona quadrifasciata]|uniref:Uncharacterized protein n=1 Tax=Melipona quadrifasciata TaxID=166423 RepID=A0A0N0U7U3_9HYME|nr:hypothetical protein WN51_02016 [Melipona quadrifasciata]
MTIFRYGFRNSAHGSAEIRRTGHTQACGADIARALDFCRNSSKRRNHRAFYLNNETRPRILYQKSDNGRYVCFETEEKKKKQKSNP